MDRTTKLPTFVLLIFLIVNMIMATPLTDNERTISALYDNLLQREYIGPVSLSDHQVERKAVRSPSLRLRFGRSDPAMATNYQSAFEKRLSGEINQKPIRSPSMRLRFGRRSDPLAPSVNENAMKEYLNVHQTYPALFNPTWSEEADENSLSYLLKRAPSNRLRWGRRSDPYLNFNIHDMLEPKVQKSAPSGRLRFGRRSSEVDEEEAEE